MIISFIAFEMLMVISAKPYGENSVISQSYPYKSALNSRQAFPPAVYLPTLLSSDSLFTNPLGYSNGQLNNVINDAYGNRPQSSAKYRPYGASGLYNPLYDLNMPLSNSFYSAPYRRHRRRSYRKSDPMEDNNSDSSSDVTWESIETLKPQTRRSIAKQMTKAAVVTDDSITTIDNTRSSRTTPFTITTTNNTTIMNETSRSEFGTTVYLRSTN
ncbi:hypothetical protein DICVIV_14119 [Dictyocaulus viviparus]|uniref:Uncharacterized protein n=1 Tax=Dictyocaulus viviparus TaxID=29172 RepID=A0A0D8XBX6_DICVI|nr:hypothetical protein DICVIV_14119 [Dictyocaulus viviparus]